MDDPKIEVIPVRLGRFEILSGVDRAAAQRRRELSAGGAAILVDETGASSGSLREMTQEFGVALATGWKHDFIEFSTAGTARLARMPRQITNGVGDLHVADAMRRLSQSSQPIVLVINPADGSPVMIQALDKGASVYALPRHKTTLPLNAGTIVPWRRVIDLAPLMFAIRPSNHDEWRA